MIEAFSVIIGAVISILITVTVENMRRPRLVIEIERTPHDRKFATGPDARWLRVIVTNQQLPWWARWMVRESATACRGSLKYSYLDLKDVFGKAMDGRWANSPEPVAARIVMDGKEYPIVDPQRFNQASQIDIAPGESEILDVAARFGTEEECFGWNNEAYFNDWRTPFWKLPKGRYYVNVTVRSAGQKAGAKFYLDNNLGREQFRLESTVDALLPKQRRDN